MSEGQLNEKVKSQGKHVIETANSNKYDDFKELVLSRISKFFDNNNEIKLAILESLLDIQSRYDLQGRVRASELPDVNQLLTQIQDLSDKNKSLEQDLKIVESSRINKIGDYSYEELKKILSNIKVIVPAELSPNKSEIDTDVLKLFLSSKEKLSIGLTNRQGTSAATMFLIRNVVSHLRIYDLAEIVRIPNVAFAKFQTSKLSNKFIATYAIEQIKKP